MPKYILRYRTVLIEAYKIEAGSSEEAVMTAEEDSGEFHLLTEQITSDLDSVSILDVNGKETRVEVPR